MENVERYKHLNKYLKDKFGERTLKICIDGGFTCPNRDGKVGFGGCIFCSEKGSVEHINSAKSISEQVLNYFKSYKAERANKFIAYFQNFTNTYDSLENLKSKYDAALIDDRIVALAIATRPDCINEEIVDLVIPDSITNLKGYNFYGLKSIKTLDLKNVQSIGDSTFAGCTGLTTIHIPESVISVGNNAFAVGYIQKSNFVNDSILDAVDNNYWGATVYDYKSEEGLYCNNNYTIKYTGENNTTINIPEGVTVIDTNTFGNNVGSYSYLTINLPSTITTLKRNSIGGIEFITVNYNGTKEQWNAITKEEEWSAWSCAGDYNDFGDNSKFTIHCTDGDVTVDGRWWA
jgi:hypothetical protein